MSKDRSNLVIDLRAGESIAIGEQAQIELVHKSGQFARLRVIAPRDVRIAKIEAPPKATKPHPGS